MKTCPHDRILEEGFDDRVGPAVVLQHRQRHLSQGEGQALALNPLAPQDHQGAEQHEVVGDKEEKPAQQDREP